MTNMEAMMEKMNAMIRSNGNRSTNQADKENTALSGNVNPPSGLGDRTKKTGRKRPCAPTANASFSTNSTTATNGRRTGLHATQDGSPSLQRQPPLDRDRGHL
jgi:hypothetical protein